MTIITAITAAIFTAALRFDLDAVVAVILLGTPRQIGELNDAAVNTVRDYAAAKGYNANALFAEEKARIEDGNLTAVGYLKVARYGSTFRIDRKTRRALWTALVTRDAFRDAA